MPHSGNGNAECLGVKEKLYWDYVEVNKFICSTLHNQINLGNNVLQNILDYSNEYIEKLPVKEDIARNSFLVIDSYIDEKVKLREEFDISEEGKELYSLESIRRRDMTPITIMTNEIFNYELKIDELNKKREIFSNDVYNIKIYEYQLKEILKEGTRSLIW